MNLSNRRFFTKLGAIVVLGIFGSAVRAAEPVQSFPEDLSYRPPAFDDRTLGSATVQEVKTLVSVFEESGKLEGTNIALGSGEDILGFDEIFATEDVDQFVALKLDLEPAQEKYLGKILSLDDGFVYHLKTATGLGAALYFSAIPEAEVQAYVEKLSARLTKIEKTQGAWIRTFSNFVVPEACAGNSSPVFTHRAPPRALPVEEPYVGKSVKKKPTTARDVLRNVGACAKGIGRGVYDSTVGAVRSVVEGAFKLVKGTFWTITHPIQAWQKATGRVKEIASLIKNFSLKKVWSKGKGGFNAMPYEAKVEFICTIVGKVGTAVALSFLLPGAINASELRIKKLFDNFSSLEKFRSWFFDPIH